MGVKQRSPRFPGAGWLSAKLSHKMIVALLAAALLGWLVSFSGYLNFLRSYMGSTYDQAMDAARYNTQQVASFLEGNQGDYTGLEKYLSARDLGCSVQDSQGAVLFQFIPEAWTDPRLTISSGEAVPLEGDTLRVYVWSGAVDRQALSDAVSHQAFVGLSLFHVVVFLAAGFLLYLLLVSPIMGLRRTMLAYSQRGTLPPRSTRLDEVGKLQNTFADLTGVLRAKEQSERRLIASISHDLKTPLTSVLGYSERLLSAPLSEEKRAQYLQSIHDKGLSIKSIIDEFDDYLDAGLRDGAPMELMDAQSLCDSLKREYQEELMDANVRLDIRCTCPGTQLLCNPAQMRRYFGNLIGNSIQHSGVQRLELEVVCRKEGDALILEFGDNGNGVPPELLQTIFEPLYTSDRGRKVSGLGLSICRSIIRAHGGAVTAENRSEGGLVVRAILQNATHYK